jgi:ornithine decarboxylase
MMAHAEGLELEVLDIGGGFPARYEDNVPTIDVIGRFTATALARLDSQGLLPRRVLCEPGRFLVAEAAVMVTTVLGRESRPDGEWLFVDCGAYNGLMEAAQSNGRWPFPMALGRSCPDDPGGTFTVTGPTCDCSDTVRHHVALPACADEGDKLMIGSAGAYSLAYASEFNGFPIPLTVPVT